MEKRRLGRNGPLVSRLGLGCMGMSDFYGPADRAESIATIHAALEAGISLFDTGDFYGMGHNELLLAEALKGKRDKAFIAVKFGAMRDPAGGFIGFDGRPQAVKNFLTYTLRRLGTDHIDLYQPARIDPAVPVEDTVGAIAEMVEAGYVRHIGLSEAGAGTLRRAHAVHPIAWLQIEYSLFSRGIEDRILPTARDLGIAISAYGVLSRGLLSGHWTKERSARGNDMRSHFPRFEAQNVEANMALVKALQPIAEDKGVTVAQLGIAWVLAQGTDIVPLIGARRPDQLSESLTALSLTLDDGDMERIARVVPADAVAGDRYGVHQAALLDSEKPEQP